MVCPECNLPDPYNGGGDGIGSCDCPRCERCGEPDPANFHHNGATCDGEWGELREYLPWVNADA